MSRLTPHLPFMSDETPLSWATRLAAFHTGDRLLPFLNDHGIAYADLAGGKPDAIARLCDIAGQDPVPVKRNTVLHIEKRSFVLRGMPLTTELLVSPRTRFCPACLAEDRVAGLPDGAAQRGRLHWQFKAVRTCSLHGIPLIDRRLRRWDDILHELPVLVPETATELSALAEGLDRRSPSTLQAYVIQRLEGATNHPWLDNMSLELAVSVSEKLGALLTCGTTARARDLSENDWDHAGSEGWRYTSRGPEGVNEALSIVQARAIAGGRKALRKVDTFGMTYPWLAFNRNGKDLEPVRSVFRDHYLNTMEAVPGDLVFGTPVLKPEFSTPAQIARLANVDARTFLNLLIGKGLLPSDVMTAGSHDAKVSYDLALAAASEMKRSVSAKTGMQMLNTSRPIWQILIKHRYLTLIGVDGDHATSRCKAVDAKRIAGVLARIEALASPVAVAPKGFRDLSKCAEISRISLDLIVPAFFEGRFESAARLTSLFGVKGVMLNPKEIIRTLRPASSPV